MAFDFNKFAKYANLMTFVGFYQVFAKKNPSDPTGQMLTDLKMFFDINSLMTRLKSQMNNMGILIAILILSPILMKTIGSKLGAFKIVIHAAVYYLIGDTLGKIMAGVPGYAGSNYSGSNYGMAAWSNDNGAYGVAANTPSAGVIRNTYGG